MIGGRAPEAPGGFTRHDAPPRFLYARPDWIASVLAAGLAEPRGWTSASDRLPGRGGAGRLSLAGRPVLHVKPMLRGGLAAPVLRDRFFGAARLGRNLTLPDDARARGIPTPPAVALLLERVETVRWRGWLAVEALEDAADLATRWRSTRPDAAEVGSVLALVRRMHDAGLRHRDLNVGNLMVRGESGAVASYVVDLDGAALLDRPLRFEERLAALERLERSYLKVFGSPGPAGTLGPDSWPSFYAPGDSALEHRLAREWGRWRWRTALRLP